MSLIFSSLRPRDGRIVSTRERNNFVRLYDLISNATELELAIHHFSVDKISTN